MDKIISLVLVIILCLGLNSCSSCQTKKEVNSKMSNLKVVSISPTKQTNKATVTTKKINETTKASKKKTSTTTTAKKTKSTTVKPITTTTRTSSKKKVVSPTTEYVEPTTEATTTKYVEPTTEATTTKYVEPTTEATTTKYVEPTTEATTTEYVEPTTEATTTEIYRWWSLGNSGREWLYSDYGGEDGAYAAAGAWASEKLDLDMTTLDNAPYVGYWIVPIMWSDEEIHSCSIDFYGASN